MKKLVFLEEAMRSGRFFHTKKLRWVYEIVVANERKAGPINRRWARWTGPYGRLMTAMMQWRADQSAVGAVDRPLL